MTPEKSNKQRFWLFKSEPNAYSFDDLKRDKRTEWDGVRNYQARNFLRDDIQIGDGVLFYHSRIKPMAVMGVATVVRSGHPDASQFDRTSKYFDPKSTYEKPRWFVVDIRYDRHLTKPVTLEDIKRQKACREMVLINNSRLSVQPVRPSEWRCITANN